MPGIPINSLQDLLVLRELKNQSNFGYSAMQALSEGVAQGIKQKQEEAKKKRESEEEFQQKLKLEKAKTNFSALEKEQERLIKSKEKKGVYVTDVEGGTIRKIADVPGTAIVQKGFVSPELTAEKARATKEVGREFEATEFIREAENIQADLNDVFQDFLDVPSDLKGPLQGKTSGELQAFLQTPKGVNLKIYNDSLQFFLSNVARRLGGEKGVLTDKDIDRIKGLMPSVLDEEEVAKRKIEKVNNFINRRIEARYKEIKSKEENTSDITKEQAISELKRRGKL